MGQAIGDSIALAVGGAKSLAFALGWLIGVGGALAVVIAVSGAIGTNTGGAPSSGTSTVKLVLGIVLLLMGFRRFRSRPAPGENAPLPKWLQAIGAITPLKS